MDTAQVVFQVELPEAPCPEMTSPEDVLTGSDVITLSMFCACLAFSPSFFLAIPSAENGVIVRNLNYRPWQWVYSISGCKSFPGGF